MFLKMEIFQIVSEGSENVSKNIVYAPDNIFKKPSYVDKLDFTWGFIQRYSGFSNENLPKITELKSVFSGEKQFLETLFRRIKYLHTLKWELEYLSERYIWNNLPEIFDIYICRFEQSICLLSEIIQQTLEFYTRNKKNYLGVKVYNFSDIGRFFLDTNNGLPTYHNLSINDSILLSILLFIRNSIVHGHRDIAYNQNGQNPIIISENIPHKERHGVLKQLYLDGTFKHFLPQYKNSGGKMDPEAFLSKRMADPKFYLNIQFKLTKSCTMDYEGTIISFTTDTYEFIKRLADGEFYILMRETFDVLLKEI